MDFATDARRGYSFDVVMLLSPSARKRLPGENRVVGLLTISDDLAQLPAGIVPVVLRGGVAELKLRG
jgi:hypothetical protein